MKIAVAGEGYVGMAQAVLLAQHHAVKAHSDNFRASSIHSVIRRMKEARVA